VSYFLKSILVAHDIFDRNYSGLPLTQDRYLKALKDGLGGLCTQLRSLDLSQLESSEKQAHRNRLKVRKQQQTMCTYM